jgi:hypothetical protein
LEKVAPNFNAFAHAAHVNLKEGKAFCFMCGPDEESIRKAHEAVHLRYDSITEVKRVSGYAPGSVGAKNPTIKETTINLRRAIVLKEKDIKTKTQKENEKSTK